ncbi:MAG: hypothetical protein V3T70_06510 [Phycisphaerae bacterium]
MPRFAGDFQGTCAACGEYVELAIGIQTDREPVAMHFGPDGPRSVAIRAVDLVSLVDEAANVNFSFDCPICGASSPGRVTCHARPTPRDS